MALISRRAEEVKEELFKESIIILIWGPGKTLPDGKAYPGFEKRLKIKEALKEKFPHANVVFSEDKELIEHTPELETQLDKELFQAKMSDIVIILPLSRGSQLELDHFAFYPEIARKIRVLLPQEYCDNPGLSGDILRLVAVEPYSVSEFDECHVATVKCIKMALSAAIRHKI